MALWQNDQSPNGFKFNFIELLKKETLGIGSYGAVCKAKCDDLLCAAKILHRTLFDPNAELQIASHREHRLPMRRFEQECEFMSAIRHPNIVQYLGTHRDPETDLPVLLMELMDDSLTHFLDSSQSPIPFHIQINICNDIVMAIAFLHSNEIVHRDLSSNNVLMIGNSRAKVTDFGMAKLDDINPQATRVSFTMCPGTDVYMPPEAIGDRPRYTEKIDCFSFGVLCIQILTCAFPKPGDRMKTVFVSDPQFPNGIRTLAHEIERRQNHISQVDPNHSLLPIALDCLKDKDVERPSAQELCHKVAALNQTSQYTDSERGVIQDRDTAEVRELQHQLLIKSQDIEYQLAKSRQLHQQEIQDLEQRIVDNQQQHAHQIDDLQQQHTHQIEAVQQQHAHQIEDLRQQHSSNLQARQEEIQHLRQELETNEQLLARFQTRIDELERSQSHRHHTQTQHQEASYSGTLSRASIELRWREGKEAPRSMYRDNDAVVNGDEVYIGGLYSIYVYNSNNSTWSELQECPDPVKLKGCSLAMVNNNLASIGGGYPGQETNQLFSLTCEGIHKLSPPMPTKRYNTIAICNGVYLIVAGGEIRGKAVTTVEVLNTDTMQWSTAADLPSPLSSSSATINGDCIFMLGGFGSDGEGTNSVLTCSLTALLQSCESSDLETRLTESLSLSHGATVWSRVADLPVKQSTCVTLGDRLLAVGGVDSDYKSISAIHMYNTSTNSWEVISHMTTPRKACYAAVLPNNKLMVAGGYTSNSNASFDLTNTVEIASIVN